MRADHKPRFLTRWGLLAVAGLLVGLVAFGSESAFGQSTTPGAPTRVTATPGLQQMTLSWVHPSEVRTGYKVRYRKASASAWGTWTSISNSALLTSHTVTGLDAGVAYEFQLRAVGSGGDGTVSATVTATPLLTKPAGLVATGGPRRVTLRWNQPSSAEVQAIANYEYRQRKGSGAWGSWTAAGSRWRNAYGITGLDGSGVRYRFELRAKSKSGGVISPVSDTVEATPYGPVGTLPSTPTGLTVQAGSNSALISWTASGDGVGGYCPTAGYFARVYEVAPSMPMAAESLRIDSGTSWYVDELRYPYRHYVEVYAESEDGCGEQSELATAFFWTSASNTNPSAPATRKLRTPFPVRDLSVDTSTSGQVTISWKKPVAIGSKRNKRCAYVDAGGDQTQKHADEYIEYNYQVYNVHTNVDYADEYFDSADATLSKTVTGLPTGTGHYLRVMVQAYSWECEQWSKTRHYSWWSN